MTKASHHFFSSFNSYLVLFLCAFMFSNEIKASEKLEFKPDYSGGQALSENIKNCTPGTFVLYNPLCLNIIKVGVDMANLNQIQDGGGKPFTQQDVTQGIQGCKVTYQIIGKEGDKCRYQILDAISNTNSNCTVSLDELSTMSENTKKIYGSEASPDATATIIPASTQQCTAIPVPK